MIANNCISPTAITNVIRNAELDNGIKADNLLQKQ